MVLQTCMSLTIDHESFATLIQSDEVYRRVPTRIAAYSCPSEVLPDPPSCSSTASILLLLLVNAPDSCKGFR